MAPPPADLRKIGEEGFALLEKFYGPTRRSSANEAFHGRRDRNWVVCQVANDQMEGPSSKDYVALPYAGTVSRYPKGKPQNRWGRPIKP